MTSKNTKKDEFYLPIGVFSQKIYLSKPHHHIEYEIFWLDDGEAEFYIDETCHIVHKGDCLFLEPGRN